MTVRVLSTALLLAAGALRLPAAEEPEPRSHMKNVLKARAAEEAKKKPGTAPTPVLPPKSEETPPAAANPAAAAPANPAAASASGKAAKVADEPATILPKVEVRKDRITMLDHNLAVQEKEIAREKKNTTPTELDKALNDPKVSKVLSIFGGQSSDNRATISQERVRMMEEEKEVIEAIAHAKTKEEKAELQKQLDQLKALRRDLEKSLH